jgi:hypothetical protein
VIDFGMSLSMAGVGATFYFQVGSIVVMLDFKELSLPWSAVGLSQHFLRHFTHDLILIFQQCQKELGQCGKISLSF